MFLDQHRKQAAPARVIMSLVLDQAGHDFVHLRPLGEEVSPS
jgi:hypothetical protein